MPPGVFLFENPMQHAVLRKLALFLFGLAAAGVACAGAVWWVRVPRGPVLPGLKVAGEALPPGADVRAFVEGRAKELRARRVRVVVAEREGGGGPHVLLEGTLGELGVAVDVDRVVALVHRLGAGGDVFARADLAARAGEGLLDVPLFLTVDSRALLARVEPLKEEEDVSPTPARLDLTHHTIVPERDGGYLDVDGAVAALERVARAPAGSRADVETVFVPVLPFKSRMTREALAEIDIGSVLASYETSFSRSGDQASRARNVEVAASRIDGAVLLPGHTVSFNEIVGARSEENGFQKAHEIFKGEMVEGIGGGTCQVASTLHAASFFGGLDILERFPHSRPSAYIPLGLDSTVVYPVVDLKLRNPFPFAVVVHASITGSRLRVELLGHEKPVAVTFAQSVLATHPFARKVVEEAGVTKPKVKQKGIRGIELRRWRVLRYASGEKRVETSTDTYPPTQEIYRVPPGFDPNELPALQEEPEKVSSAGALRQG